MRRALLMLLGAGLLVPVAASAALDARATDGTLSVVDAKGFAQVSGRAAVIGRVAEGSITVVDLTPFDAKEPTVTGWKQVRQRGTSTIYTGEKLRFRAVGGAHRISLRGSGIDLSAVGRGTVVLDGDGVKGIYSTKGDDCRVAPTKCDPVPNELTRLVLGRD